MSLRAARAFKLGRPDARLAILTPAKLEAFWKSIAEVDEVISFAPEESVFAIAGQTARTFRGGDTLPRIRFAARPRRGLPAFRAGWDFAGTLDRCCSLK